MSRVWVGGATGFFGETLVRALVAAGQEVTAVSRHGGQVDGLPVAAVDATDADAVARSARGCDVAYCVIGKVSRNPSAAAELYRANVEACRGALDGLRDAKVSRVVYASTSGTLALGGRPLAFDETHRAPHELISRWPYYRSKARAEQLALERNAPGRFEVIVVNPALLLGPGDRRGTATLDVARCLAEMIDVVPAGGLSVVDVRDAASAMISAAERGRPGERYLLSSANMRNEVFFGRIARLGGVAGPRFTLPFAPETVRFLHWARSAAAQRLGAGNAVDASSVDMGCYFWYCDASKAKAELGFQPRCVDDTLRDTIQYLQGVA